MTFEQRDNAAKVIPNRQQLSTTHSHSLNRHNKPSPSSRQPLREGSGRRTTQSTTAYLVDPTEDFGRRDLTADFIHFSRNLQQANIEKTIGKQSMGRCPSAPNLAVSPDLLPNRVALSPRHHAKLSRNSLHPLIGQSFLSPYTLHRQALSVDNSEYYPQTVSPPRSKRSSRQGSTSTAGGRGSAESLETEMAARRLHSSQASMMLDLHMPNDCPISMRIRDRNRRSDTARRHMLTRQTQIESEEDSAEHRDSRSGSPQFGARAAGAGAHSSSTPHSRRESYSPRMSSVDDPAYQYRCRLNEIVLRGSSPSLQHKRPAYLRSNTVCNEPSSCRRSSNTSESGLRKGSADFHYHRNRRKSSNTSESSRYCSRTNVDEMRHPRNRSPTSSLRSFQELRYLTQRLNETELKNESLKQMDTKRKQGKYKHQSPKGRGSRVIGNQSLSPDSASISSTTTEGHSKSEFTSVDVESTDNDCAKKTDGSK
ncbi:hypothetical protein V9T40_001949 [Parthenolecanium corni]|uniref:Uncharacterized protein n=1 Tax=Parthenolecanium corni TaxID=536013 RepID=A0AAN9THI8_9HEMI